MNDSLFVRRFERLRDLLRDRQRFVDRNRPLRNSIRKRWTLHEFEHERTNPI